MSENIGIQEARERFADLITAAKERGEPTIITRHGKPAAVLISPADFAQSFQYMSEAARRMGESFQHMNESIRYAKGTLAPIVEHLKEQNMDKRGPLAVGDRVSIPADSVPEDWSREGEVAEIGDETIIVELDGGHRQEVPATDVTTA
jgi:prevent-host-death family protein